MSTGWHVYPLPLPQPVGSFLPLPSGQKCLIQVVNEHTGSPDTGALPATPYEAWRSHPDLTSGPGPVLPAQMFLGCPLSWVRKLSVVLGLGVRQRSLLASWAGLSAGVWDRVRGQDGYWLSKFPESRSQEGSCGGNRRDSWKAGF